MKLHYLILLLPLAACARQVVVDPAERLAMARELTLAGDSAAATRIAAVLARDQPEWSQPYLEEFAGWAIAAGDWAHARDWADRALAERQDSLAALRCRGIARQHLGDPVGAVADLDRVERTAPPDGSVERALGLALVALDQEPERARALLLDPRVGTDAEVEAALARIEERLLPPWAREAAPTLATVARVLEEELGLTRRLQVLRQDWDRAREHGRAAAALQDLPADPVAAGALRACVEAGVLLPREDRLGCDAPLTRGRLAALVARLLDATVGRPDIAAGAAGPTPFADLSPRHPLFPDVQAAVAVGALAAGPGRDFRIEEPASGRDLLQAVGALRRVWATVPVRAAAPPVAQEPPPPAEPPAEPPATAMDDLLEGVFLGTGLGLDREQGLEAAYEDALRQAAAAWGGELGFGELPGLLEESVVANLEDTAELLQAEPLEESWDPDQNLARVRLRVRMERDRFQGLAGRALRVVLTTAGELDPAVASTVRGRLVAQGFEVLPAAAARRADAIVRLEAVARDLPARLRRHAWECSLVATVTARSSLGATRRLLLEQTIGPERILGSSAGEVLRGFPPPEARARLADDIAGHILRGRPSQERLTVILQAGAGRRHLLDDVVQGLRARQDFEVDAASVVWRPPVASFTILVDRRAASEVAQVLQSITLDAGRRVRVLRAAGDRVLARIVDPARD